MDSPSSPSSALENLMRAGQQATQQCDDALASIMHVDGKPATGKDLTPFAAAVNLQRWYWSELTGFWKKFVNVSPAGAQPAGRDRRFKDEAWQQSPVHD